jgi:hypothetical protein
MASTMRGRSSGPATCVTKASLVFTHIEGRQEEGKGGGKEEEEEEEEGKNGERTHLELLVEEDCPKSL